MSHEEDYVESISQLKGVNVARPLTEKGTGPCALEKLCDLRTSFSLGGDGSPGARGNANVQKGARGYGYENPLLFSC